MATFNMFQLWTEVSRRAPEAGILQLGDYPCRMGTYYTRITMTTDTPQHYLLMTIKVWVTLTLPLRASHGMSVMMWNRAPALVYRYQQMGLVSLGCTSMADTDQIAQISKTSRVPL